MIFPTNRVNVPPAKVVVARRMVPTSSSTGMVSVAESRVMSTVAEAASGWESVSWRPWWIAT